jgi:rSAM/selenodomain-associated transferase 2
MKFSIIIPTLNEEKNIQSCLSALQPLRNECEIIVVDAESIDNTQALALPLANKIIVSAKGRSIQMNEGASQATGDVLIFLHVDTTLPEHALRLIDQQISPTRPWGRFDIQLDGYSIMFRIIAWMMNWRSRISSIATGDQVIFVTRSIFEKVGRYPEISLMEDIALSKALNKISRPICLKAKVISSGRRWERNGIFRTILLMWSLRLRYSLGANPQTLALLYNQNTFTQHKFNCLWKSNSRS